MHGWMDGCGDKDGKRTDERYAAGARLRREVAASKAGGPEKRTRRPQ